MAAAERAGAQYGAVEAREEGVYDVFEEPLNRKDLPPEIRTGFIKKTYGLLFYMLLISFGIASIFVFTETEKIHAFITQYPWVTYTAVAVIVGFIIFNVVAVFTSCCGMTGFIKAYIRLFKVFPINVLFLTVFSAAFGLLIGLICAKYTATSVCWVFALCAVIIAGLTVYAVTTEHDFTGYGMYFLVALLAFFFTGIFCAAWGGPIAHKVFAGVGAMLFGFIIVYDTQLIFGVSEFSKHERAMQYTVDMYAFAALELYLDFINFFIYMLEIMGTSR